MRHKSAAAKMRAEMNLVYFLGSLIGVALIVGLNVALFGRAKPILGNLQDLGSLIAADVPGFRAGCGVVGSDGAAALVEDEGSAAIFLVGAIGDRIVTRKLSPATLHRMARDGSVLSLQLRDFAFPKTRITLADNDAARAWEARLKQAAA
jgi:hypothetical protein